MNLQISNFELHFIHGFLGLPSDWESCVMSSCSATLSSPGLTRGSTVHFHDINDYLDCSMPTFQNWVDSFYSSLVTDTAQKKVLIGYSLGGRLALHCLQHSPSMWDAAILISTHPGLLHEHEKILRIEHDENWAKRFLEEPWENVLNSWNSQGVFCNQKNCFVRNETHFKKESLSKQLTCFSLGKQENFRPFLKKSTVPILWVSGNHDVKFTQITFEIESFSNTHISTAIIRNAGHRVPWENTEDFMLRCQQFLNHL